MADTTPAPDRDDVVALARSAGLALPEPYLSELIEAYGHVHAMLERQRRSQVPSGEPAHVFVPLALGAGEEQGNA